ncbi:MAG: hypothetical protein JSW14_05260 [Candidatus Bathyarchaeum sp.]|nr:MAG: hypothetical protein JSW14_05260 [Candidatus Bathyarchaeum sp.]
MIVNVVFYDNPTITIPNACCKCSQLFPSELIEVRVADFMPPLGIHQGEWIFRFPYCSTCARELKRGGSFFKGRLEAVSIHRNWVRTKKIGSFLRKKKIKYIPFKFTNERYGQLFKEANNEMLLEKVLAELV